MDRAYLRAAREFEVLRIIEALEKQQFVRPHQGVVQAVSVAGQEVGFCPVASAQALEWLQLDADKPVGRLRRSEILQLSRSIQRFWRENALWAEEPSQTPA